MNTHDERARLDSSGNKLYETQNFALMTNESKDRNNFATMQNSGGNLKNS